MSYQAKGTLSVIYDENKVSEKFKKREFVLEMQDGMYTEHVKFQLVQDRCSLLDSFQTGQEIVVHFNLKGRPYTRDGKTTYFTNLDAWRVEPSQPAGDTKQDAPGETAATGGDDATGMTFSDDSSEDDLPF